MSVRSSAAISGAPDFAAFLHIPVLTHAPRRGYLPGVGAGAGRVPLLPRPAELPRAACPVLPAQGWNRGGTAKRGVGRNRIRVHRGAADRRATALRRSQARTPSGPGGVMTGEVGAGLTASWELAAQIRVVHRRALRSLDRKLWSERGEFVSERRPPSLESPVDDESGRGGSCAGLPPSADAACPGQFPAGGTEVRVSVSAHHVRTRAPVWLSAGWRWPRGRSRCSVTLGGVSFKSTRGRPWVVPRISCCF